MRAVTSVVILLFLFADLVLMSGDTICDGDSCRSRDTSCHGDSCHVSCDGLVNTTLTAPKIVPGELSFICFKTKQ